MNEQQTTLHLPIQRQWYDMIKSGVKLEEYREIKWYYCPRLFKDKVQEWAFIRWGKRVVEDYVTQYDDVFKHFDTVTLRNGYGKNAPTLVVECLGITVGKGNPDWGAPEEQVFIIKLGNILKER